MYPGRAVSSEVLLREIILFWTLFALASAILIGFILWRIRRNTKLRELSRNFSAQDLVNLQQNGAMSKEEFEKVLAVRAAQMHHNHLPPPKRPRQTRPELFPKPKRPPFCPKCGYDLRATPDRCPECGTVIAPGKY